MYAEAFRLRYMKRVVSDGLRLGGPNLYRLAIGVGEGSPSTVRQRPPGTRDTTNDSSVNHRPLYFLSTFAVISR